MFWFGIAALQRQRCFQGVGSCYNTPNTSQKIQQEAVMLMFGIVERRFASQP